MQPGALLNGEKVLLDANMAREVQKEAIKEKSASNRAYEKLKNEIIDAISEAIHKGESKCDVHTSIVPIGKIAEKMNEELKELGYHSTFGLLNKRLFFKISWRETEK